jgi:hypothetical protein
MVIYDAEGEVSKKSRGVSTTPETRKDSGRAMSGRGVTRKSVNGTQEIEECLGRACVCYDSNLLAQSVRTK